jgi:two-component SAPR family response regulator
VAFRADQRDKALANLDKTCALADQLGFDEFLVVDSQRLLPLLHYAREQKTNPVVSRWLERAEARPAPITLETQPLARIEPVTLMVYALGKPRVQTKGDNVQWATLQSRDLFFYMLQNSQGLTKEEIGAVFWPEHPPHKLESIFRSTLYRLRRALFRECVVFEDNLYRFNRTSAYWFDVQVFEYLLDQAEQAQMLVEEKRTLLEEALALYQGDYLEGLYADWCAMERERLRGRYLTALETLADLCAERGDLQRAMELYQAILAQDQYQETAHRGLMRCYHRLGDRAAAIRQYQICARILRQELDLAPMRETQQLYLQITS